MKRVIFALLALLLSAPSAMPVQPSGDYPPDMSTPARAPGPDLPGTIKGSLETYWLWPFVKASKNPDGSYAVTWFGEKGNVVREANASYVGSGYIDLAGKNNVVEGINANWKIALPPSPDDDDGLAQATPDSRIFLDESTPEHGRLMLNVYVNGKLASTLGPFFQYEGEDVEVEDNISANGNDCAGLLVWKDKTKTTAQVLVIDGSGAISLRQDCDAEVDAPHAAPDGKGVLIEDNGGHENTFMWYTEKGKTQTLKIEPNPWVQGWLPHTHKALFSTSVGYDNRYRLVDWDTGKPLWDIPSPGKGRNLAVGITPDLILFSQAELFDGHGPWMGESLSLDANKPEWIRVLYAADAKSGKVVASWRAVPGRILKQGRGEFFCWAGGKFYFVTPTEFAELNLDDIKAGKNGWKLLAK